MLTSTSTPETEVDNISSTSKSQYSEVRSHNNTTQHVPDIISAVHVSSALNKFCPNTEVMANNEPQSCRGGKGAIVSTIDWSRQSRNKLALLKSASDPNQLRIT